MMTRDQLIQIAQHEIQTKGYAGFSYADLSQQVGISKASIHHHFPTKADLGQEVAKRYWESFLIALDEIMRDTQNAKERLQRYAQLFVEGLQNDVVCAGIMLASDRASLPDKVLMEVQHFVQINEEWLETVLEQGRQNGELWYTGSAHEAACTLFAALEGAQLFSRADANFERLQQVAAWVIDMMAVKSGER
jgi:TetR/AcrR family transcriptional regulator, transcriptional repressor for nem operon